ncbi:hypothetical protein CEP53_013225 [Fusarium sp. AF-6]|nr:hypothetical protein CEP53_013225 [Fusarium sp. AF-6]
MANLISPETASALRARIDLETSGPDPKIPGLVYCAVNRDGDIIFSHASGTTALGGKTPMSMDTTFWLASFTKTATGIACMQLIEQGRLALDDHDLIERLAPELRDVQVLEEQPNGSITLVHKKTPITLKMLLTHTSGFGYTFSVPKLRDWSRPTGLDDFSGIRSDTLNRPLVHQPGTTFEYGTGVDWAGVLVERVTGQSLEDYFQEHIFQPLGIQTISFRPTNDVKARLATMHHRDPSGKLHIRDHLYRAPLVEEDPDKLFCMGGAGCFGAPIEYCNLIATLLNDGTHPKTGAQLLKPETVELMLTDQIPEHPRHLNEFWESAKPDLTNQGPIMTYEDTIVLRCSEDVERGIYTALRESRNA